MMATHDAQPAGRPVKETMRCTTLSRRPNEIDWGRELA